MSNSSALEIWEKAKPKLVKTKKISGKVLRFFCKLFLVLFVVIAILGCIAGGYLGCRVLPMLDDYKKTAYEKFDSIGPNTFTYLKDTVIFDKNGEVLRELNVGNYEYAEIENVSKWVQEGYIAVEDKRFKVHNGIDYKALARASFALVKNKGKITQGGSTITQQVIKNNLLTQERTFERKLIELFLAPEFEKKYSKQDIMEFYVNTNFYGNNCYGIESAAQYYFGKSVSDLTIGESALFVGMSNNASYYNPKKNYDETMQKWRFVLNEMAKEGIITQEEYDKTLSEGLNFVYARENRKKEDYLTSYAIHSAVISLMDEQGFEYKYLFDNEKDYTEYKDKYAELYNDIAEKIRSGGYMIYTSLDPDMQDTLQRIIDSRTSGFKEKTSDGRYAFQTAAVIVNNETGYVEAIVGGRGTDDEFNRGFLAKRQPGSSIKPLVSYAPAFNSGMYYPSLVMTDKDDPTDKYYPKNYGGNFLGNMTIREAVGRSTNTIAYQIMKSIGANTGLEYLGKMRFDTISHIDNNNTAVALGGFTYGVRVTDMAKGYSTLVNRGEYIDNNCVMKIEYQNEGAIFEEKSERISIYEPDAAYMMVDCCKAVVYEPYGTSKHRVPDNAIVMAKTGTTNDSKDAWFCGSSVYYSMAVWAGYDTPRPTSLTGGSLPGQIWDEMMTKLHKDLKERDFERPETVIDKPINHKGEIAKYDTGVYDIFSQTLLDKAEAERKAIRERKKISADNQLISEIEIGLKELRNYIIGDNASLTYLNQRFNDLKKSIDKVYQEEHKNRLSKELDEIKDFYTVDIRNMQKYNDRQKTLAEVQSKVDKENAIVTKLNDFNNYVISNRNDVVRMDNLYKTLEKEINKLSDKSKVDKYMSIYKEIKGYKEILLRPYRAEIEEEQKIEREKAESQLMVYLEELNGYTTYDEKLETLFELIESQFDYCKSINVNISGLYPDYIADKEYFLQIKERQEEEKRREEEEKESQFPTTIPNDNKPIVDMNVDSGSPSNKENTSNNTSNKNNTSNNISNNNTSNKNNSATNTGSQGYLPNRSY